MVDSKAGTDPGRVVKLRLPTSLVRAMDQAILRSNGSYLDRNEFVAEAIWDRLNEDAIPPEAGGIVQSVRPSPSEPVSDNSIWPFDGPLATDLSSDVVPCKLNGTNFGLHNRDLPTLWAVADLARYAGSTPVPWKDYSERLRFRAQQAGQWLRRRDLASVNSLKASTGFPKPGEKARASEDRFLAAAVGEVKLGTGPVGPAFLFGLIGIADRGAGYVGLTAPGISLIRSLIELGMTYSLPHAPSCAKLWLHHLTQFAPDEAKAWLAVLGRISERPTRSELVSSFPEWPGSMADTNCAGFVSRAREWGFVVPGLMNSRYELTDAGQQILKEGNHR